MAYETLGVVTTAAKARLAQMLATGKSFQVTHFVIGDVGYLPSDPTIALTPDPNITSFVYGNVLTKPITGVSFPLVTCPQWECDVLPADYAGPVSAIYLIATVQYNPNPADPDVVGTQFIFAVATKPLSIKTPNELFAFQVGVFL